MADISSWNILIVDDDPGIRQILAIVLEMHGGKISMASTGKEALAKMRSSLPTMVITDMDMPGMDGRQLLNSIRADADFAHIPVVAITGNQLTRVTSDTNGAGFTAVIRKPFNARSLVDRLVEACS